MAAVAVVVVFAVTAFVAPGFLVKAEPVAGEATAGGVPPTPNTTSTTRPSTTKSTPSGPVRTVEQTKELIVTGVLRHDKPGLTALKCGDATPRVDPLIGQVDPVRSAFFSTVAAEQVGPRWRVDTLTMTPRGAPDVSNYMVLQRDGNSWCLWDVVPARGERPSLAEVPYGPRAVINEFLAKVNANDVEGALDSACAQDTTEFRTQVEQLAAADGDVRTAPGGEIGRTSYLIKLTGTKGGEEMRGEISATSWPTSAGITCVGTAFLV
ncbi:hypothetical protein EV193_104536 [Herbihabitans rhizosphaerae]|uniref:Uncharacterized protein n=1 Tax=Herbihabitans rhizosphaerae TaxID=1872711 RepID=A0A4Q7KR46_9PSEU|nr:hypothetical protein EV193_104536 [Herbihabitans rhizosphaerae]